MEKCIDCGEEVNLKKLKDDSLICMDCMTLRYLYQKSLFEFVNLGKNRS